MGKCNTEQCIWSAAMVAGDHGTDSQENSANTET